MTQIDDSGGSVDFDSEQLHLQLQFFLGAVTNEYEKPVDVGCLEL